LNAGTDGMVTDLHPSDAYKPIGPRQAAEFVKCTEILFVCIVVI
jgi:hypothetical protein